MQRILFTLFIYLLIALSSAQASEKNAQVWKLEDKEVPIPSGSSESLQNSLRAIEQPDVKARLRQTPKNRQQWDQMISERANARNTPLDQIEQMMSVKIDQTAIKGVNAYWITPTKASAEHKNHLMLYVHGGAYVFGGGEASVFEASIISNSSGIKVLSIDYRMPPQYPFPQAIEDTISVYQEILKRYESDHIAFGGTSAGGGLALAVAHKIKDLGLPQVGAIYAGTPWADLTKTGDTLYTNEGLDRVLVTYDGMLKAAALLYADGNDLRSPLLSPVYGNFDEYPPTILVTGTRDMFLSDTARTHQKIRAAGGTADLLVFEGLSHAGYMFDLKSPESQLTYQEISKFLKTHLHK